MKGIILAGGSGTRLGACTWAVSKQLLPIYDKPMIYYPLSVLMLTGISEVVVVTTPQDAAAYRAVLGDGSELGMQVEYRVQDAPNGIADALLVAADAVEGEPVCLILGDNFFYGQGFVENLLDARAAVESNGGACVFAYPVTDPRAFGVVEFDQGGRARSIEEKPANPRSKWAVPGIYFFDGNAVRYARELRPSERGELEITDLNRRYLSEGALRVVELGRGMAWLDTGTPQGLLQASQFVETIQARQGLYIACVEEVAYRQGFIGADRLPELADRYGKTEYAGYVHSLATEA